MNVPLGHVTPLAKCPVCQKKYASAMGVPLSDDDTHSTLHLSCPSCGVSSILSVSASQWGVASIGVLTDLSGEEARASVGKEAVPVEDALDAYIFLNQSADQLAEILD
ncbi:MAG: hypothetical protein IPL87_04930 [Candidatus Moraniibacteriota bacterium]|nr:MAG: hypothetical protein IPL87_04930 [Candidatus Moranbacteria bacterium]